MACHLLKPAAKIIQNHLHPSTEAIGRDFPLNRKFYQLPFHPIPLRRIAPVFYKAVPACQDNPGRPKLPESLCRKLPMVRKGHGKVLACTDKLCNPLVCAVPPLPIAFYYFYPLGIQYCFHLSLPSPVPSISSWYMGFLCIPPLLPPPHPGFPYLYNQTYLWTAGALSHAISTPQ